MSSSFAFVFGRNQIIGFNIPLWSGYSFQSGCYYNPGLVCISQMSRDSRTDWNEFQFSNGFSGKQLELQPGSIFCSRFVGYQLVSCFLFWVLISRSIGCLE